jgi:hypothetical protein
MLADPDPGKSQPDILPDNVFQQIPGMAAIPAAVSAVQRNGFIFCHDRETTIKKRLKARVSQPLNQI